jgi:hypothetical protein
LSITPDKTDDDDKINYEAEVEAEELYRILGRAAIPAKDVDYGDFESADYLG